MATQEWSSIVPGTWRATKQEFKAGSPAKDLEEVLDSLEFAFEQSGEVEIEPLLEGQVVNYMELNYLKGYVLGPENRITFNRSFGNPVVGTVEYSVDSRELGLELTIERSKVRFTLVKIRDESEVDALPPLSDALASACKAGIGEYFSNISFKTSDGRMIHAHQFIIQNRCPYIRRKIQKHGLTGTKTKNAFVSYAYDTVYKLFEYIYSDVVDPSTLSSSELKDLSKLAEKCEFTRLKKICERATKYSSIMSDVVASLDSGLQEFSNAIEILKSVNMASDEATYSSTRFRLIQSMSLAALRIVNGIVSVPTCLKEAKKKDRKTILQLVEGKVFEFLDLATKFVEAGGAVDRDYFGSQTNQSLVQQRCVSFFKDFLSTFQEVVGLLGEAAIGIESQVKGRSTLSQIKFAHQMGRLTPAGRKFKQFLDKESDTSSADVFLRKTHQQQMDIIARRLDSWSDMRVSMSESVRRIQMRLQEKNRKLTNQDIIQHICSDFGWVFSKYRDFVAHLAPITLLLSSRLAHPEINELLERLGFIIDPSFAGSSEVQINSTVAASGRVDSDSTYITDMRSAMVDDGTDVWIGLDDGDIPAHKVVLATRSKYFAAAFLRGLREASSTDYHLGGYKVSTFRVLLEYWYTGAINFPEDPNEVMQVLALADLVQSGELKSKGGELLKSYLSRDNITALYGFAEQFSMEDLKEQCIQFAASVYDENTPFEGYESLPPAAQEKIQFAWMKLLESGVEPSAQNVEPEVVQPHRPSSQSQPVLVAEPVWDPEGDAVSQESISQLLAMFPHLGIERARELILAADHNLERAANFCLSME